MAGRQRQATEALEARIRALGDELVAVLVEPGFMGEGDILTYPDGFLDRLEAVTREVGALLILDETAVGLGRSGKLFACQRERINPDLLCLANGLTGGYLPLAATLATEAIYCASRVGSKSGSTLPHQDAYGGNPLACAAAVATLDVLHGERLLERVPLKIDYLRRSLDRLRVRPAVGQIRQYGLAVGIELVADRKSRRPFAAADRIGMQVCRAARDRHVLAQAQGDVIVLMPPLTITAHQIDQLVDAVDHGIRSATV